MAEHTPDLALFFEAGTGKTRTTIEIIRRRCAKEKRLMRILVLGPKVVLHNWKREFAAYSKIIPRDIHVLDQTPVAKRVKYFDSKFLNEKTAKYEGGGIIITNYEAVQNDNFLAAISQWQPEIVVCDESHRCKGHTSVRAKRVHAIAKRARHRYLLTGTPILNTGMDIFNQYLILDNGETFGQNFYAFRGQYFQDENERWKGKPGYFPKWGPRVSTYQELNNRIYRKALRAVKSECLDLPPLVRERRDVELSPEQLRMYKEMRDQYLTYVKGLLESDEPRAIVAQLAITKALRLQQIVSGFAKDEEGTIHRIPENPRLDALHDDLEELAPYHKVIVWAAFKENYKYIAEVCEKLKLPYAELHGEIKDKDKQEKYFRFDPKCRVMIANQGAGGIGINLTEAPYSLYYSRGFKLEHDLQSEARNYRGGSEMHQSITRIDYIAKDTIDELIAESLAAKQDVALKILDWKDL